MLFVFIDDGTVDVVAGLADARREYEALDVAGDVYRFYDEAGAPLEAVFPDRRERRLLGLRVGEELGDYELRPAAAGAGDPMELALDEAAALNPNPWFRSLDEIRAHVRARRAPADPR